MATLRHLNNAPITEALIDIRIKELDSSHSEQLSQLPEKFSKIYTTKKAMHRKLFSLQVGNAEANQDVSAKDEATVYGYRFESTDLQKVAQFRLDGFTLSHLRPYSDWETLVSEAKELYEHYRSISQPEFVARIALRYINQIDIPLPIIDFSDYLTAPPTVPDKLPQGLLKFLTQYVVQFPDENAIAKITQGLEGITKPDSVSILLDIDVFVSNEFAPDSEAIWETFEQLRNLKNQIFSESLTKKTMELFE